MKAIIEKYGIVKIERTFILPKSYDPDKKYITNVLLQLPDIIPVASQITFNSSYIPEFYRLKFEFPLEEQVCVRYDYTDDNAILRIGLKSYDIDDENILADIRYVTDLSRELPYDNSGVCRYSTKYYLKLIMTIL